MATLKNSPARQEQLHRMQGRVKWFNEMKGFGYITPDDGTHAILLETTREINGSQTHQRYEPGQYLEFDVKQNHRGRPMATNVTRLEERPSTERRATPPGRLDQSPNEG